MEKRTFYRGKNSMADIGVLIVSTFCKWLSPILVACHMANYTKGFVTTETAKEEEPEYKE